MKHPSVIFVCLVLTVFSIAVQAQGTKTITVERGETLELLAKRHNVTVDEIKEVNPYMTKCHTGMTLNIPLPPPKPVVETLTSTSLSAETDYQPQRKKSRNNFWGILAAGLLGGAAAYIQAQQAMVPRVPAYKPATTSSAYSASTSYYTSLAYLAQVQARANQSMSNFHAQMQRIGQQALQNNQQMLNRSRTMFGELTSWSLGFTRDNGREPTALEKSEWVRQHYPDMYSSYIQAQSAGSSGSEASSSGSSYSSSSRSSGSSSIPRTKCPNCKNGQRVYETSGTLSFGLEPRMKRCDVCGESYDSAHTTHRHGSCNTCHGSGYLD